MNSRPTSRIDRWAAALLAARKRAFAYRRTAATVAATGMAVFMGYHVMFGHNGLTAFKHKREDATYLRQEMHDLQMENDRLHEHVTRLQNDPGAIEHQAREELHYTRSGEVIYTLPPDPAPVAKH